ncbi:MAG: DNA mismatch repair protein MutS [Pseudomonadota bacterium]
MMAQYLEIKEANPGSLLFYRMGDFYEMFFDDAVAAAEALDIALTKRGKHDGADIPMCGVPVHAAETYLQTLIRKGFRVAVCEQLESPAEAKKRGSKSVVKRDVVRTVTPGTLTEDALLEARSHNYLAALAVVRDDAALAWVDVSTGAFSVMPLTLTRIGPELARLAPSEVLVSEAAFDVLRYLETDLGLYLTSCPRSSFDSARGTERLKSFYGVASLEAYGSFERAELSAMGALIDYLELTQKGKLPRLTVPRRETLRAYMQIDAATRRNLELTQALGGGRAGSLLATIDRTVTAGGARLLERRLSSPSRDLTLIRQRQENVAYFVEQRPLATALGEHLARVPDFDRALSRISLDRAGPRDLAAVRDGLIAADNIAKTPMSEPCDGVLGAISEMKGHDSLIGHLDAALVAEPPVQLRDGGLIAPGFDENLDAARQLRDEGRGVIAQLQARYVEATGVTSLKIKHNNVLGYFIETTATHSAKMMSPPLSETFIHRQTTANQVRFTTPELSALETKILNAGAEAAEIERRIFDSLCAAIMAQADAIYRCGRALAELDLSIGLANLAVSEDWCRPALEDSRAFDIEAGRHPVVEAALKKGGAHFVGNTCNLSDDRIWLLTGPNMAGKSTFLRQNALIAILAQMGSFVPARSARIGIVSQLFSRVGASDDLARGRSTFMVEMVETAAILNQADDRALVILDEIGRGTATYDGLSIAWATLEHLHGTNRCRALFATHYHEMSALAGSLDGVENATVAVREFEGDIVFLHEVRKGAADRSYGVQVAQLAGLPQSVIDRARTVLEQLEQGEREGGSATKALIDDLPLFSAIQAPEPQQEDPALGLLDDVAPDELSPREALDLIYKLKAARG